MTLDEYRKKYYVEYTKLKNAEYERNHPEALERKNPIELPDLEDPNIQKEFLMFCSYKEAILEEEKAKKKFISEFRKDHPEANYSDEEIQKAVPFSFDKGPIAKSIYTRLTKKIEEEKANKGFNRPNANSEELFVDMFFKEYEKIPQIGVPVEEQKKDIEKALQDSKYPSAIPFKTQRQLKHEAKVRRAKIIITTALLVVTISSAKVMIDKANLEKEIRSGAYEVSQVLSDNKESGKINPNTNTPYWWYGPFLYEAIDKDTEHDIDTKIFSYYYYLKGEYNGMDTLNGIVNHLTGKSFAEYLLEQGYSMNDIDKWSKESGKRLLEVLKEKEVNIEQMDVTDDFGGRNGRS